MSLDSKLVSSSEQIERSSNHLEHTDVPIELDSQHVAIQNETFAINEEALGTNLPKNYYRSFGFIGTIIALCLGNISNYLGYVLPANLLTYIDEDIGPSPNITWVSISYTLGLSVGFLIVGRFSDIFGRRWFFIVGNGFGLLGSIVGATAKNVNTLIGADVLMGLAGAVQISFTVAVSELVPNKVRPLAVSAIFFSSFEIACFGPVIGISLENGTKLTWRWAYYLNIIISGLAVLCFYLFYHPPDFNLLHMDRSKWEQCKRQDGVGFVLFTGGLLLFIMGMSWGGTVHPWNSIATIVVGFCLLAAFVAYDAYVHQGDALLPARLFRQPGYLAMIITATVGSCVYYSMNVLWPKQISYLFKGSTLHDGWLACIVGSSCLLGQVVGGVLCRYIKQSRWILMTGCASLLAFSAAMVSIKPGEQAKGIGLMFSGCFSVGIIETCSLSLAPLTLPTEDIGAAVGALGSIRSGGASVATAIYVTILNNKLATLLSPAMVKAAESAGLPESSVSALEAAISSGDYSNVPGINSKISTAINTAKAAAAANAFKFVWYAVIAFASVALLASYTTIDYGEYLNNDVARKIRQSKGNEEGSEKEIKPSSDV
ncbi:unnamed protein product [Penicillium manginii]